jgi:uncharacterized protein
MQSGFDDPSGWRDLPHSLIERTMASEEHELTGNDYVSVPTVYADGGMDGINVLHGGLAGLVEWSGESAGRPLFRPVIRVAGQDTAIRDARWRRLDRWIPAATAALTDSVDLTLTVCAPGGYPSARGFLVRLELENRGRAPVDVELGLDICWRWTRHWIASARPLAGTNTLHVHGSALVLSSDGGRGPALAVMAAGEAVASIGNGAGRDASSGGDTVEAANGADALHGQVAQRATLTPSRRTAFTFFIGAGRERDGAITAAAALRRAGGDAWIRQARLDLSHTIRAGQDHRWGDTLNRNLLFNRYYAAGRGIDDDRLYLLRSRSTACPAPAVFNEREALLWTIPALILADPGIAREALFRVFELFSERAGEYQRYLDGGSLDPAFCLDQYLLYPWAADHYMRATDDPSVLDEPIVRQVLYEADSSLFMRLDVTHMLASTDLLPSGDVPDHPYTTFSNALLWAFCDALPRLLPANGPMNANGMNDPAADDAPRFLGAGAEVAAAVWQHCVTDVGGEPVFSSSASLDGNAAIYDDPLGSLAMLPFFGFCAADDPVWTSTMEFLRSSRYPLWLSGAAADGLASRSRPRTAHLAALCADLLGPGSGDALQRLLRIRLPGGIAAAAFDVDTGQATEPYHAALAGFLAWSLLRAADTTRPVNEARRRR